MSFYLSIEFAPMKSFKPKTSIGNDIDKAKIKIEKKFKRRTLLGKPTVTIALMLDNKIVDIFLGDEWQSNIDMKGNWEE